MSAEEPTTTAAEQVEESTAHFEPIVKLDQTVEVKTHEEDEEVLFKMYVPCFPPNLVVPKSGRERRSERQWDGNAPLAPCTAWEVAGAPGSATGALRNCGRGAARAGSGLRDDPTCSPLATTGTDLGLSLPQARQALPLHRRVVRVEGARYR